jgi:hypothetical protein
MQSMTYAASTGTESDFFWIRCNAEIAVELFEECPELVEGRYVVMMTFDGISVMRSRETKGDRWDELHAPRIVASPKEIPWSGNGEEVYLFENKPGDESLRLIKDFRLEMFDKFSLGEPAVEGRFWDMLAKTFAESYLSQGSYFFLATRSRGLFDKVVSGEVIRGLPTRRQREIECLTQNELEGLGPECGPEICADARCGRLRIELGVFCAEHHLAMLRQ